MINGVLKSKLDKLWLDFYAGGIANPLTVIEQITLLMFARMLDMQQMRAEKRAKRLKKDLENPVFPKDKQRLRWSHLVNLGAEEQLDLMLKEILPFFKEHMVSRTPLGRYMQGVQCLIQKPSLMKTAVNAVNELPLHQGDTKGDLYEYMLGKLTTAGYTGAFRTPRHIIRAMVEMLDVKPDDTVCDPACGTGGFLIETMDYLRRTHSSKELIHEELDEETGEVIKDDHGNPMLVYPGDLLDPYRNHIENDMFHGFDFDATMLRIAAMNMLLHGIESPCIEYQDSLSDNVADRFPEYYQNAFDVILANPPFKGSIDADSVHKSLTSVAKTTKTELLFLVLMMRMLKIGGRCAVIVPDGVLFGSSAAHKAVRRMLVDDHQLQAVVSLPAGVFKPYAGVSTAVLLFTKGGKTKDVWFYKVENDGYSLDDKRTPVENADLPDLIKKWHKRSVRKMKDRTKKCFFVPKADIVANNYDLSINRYREVKYEEKEYDPPKVILTKLRELEQEIINDIDELEKMLG